MATEILYGKAIKDPTEKDKKILDALLGDGEMGLIFNGTKRDDYAMTKVRVVSNSLDNLLEFRVCQEHTERFDPDDNTEPNWLCSVIFPRRQVLKGQARREFTKMCEYSDEVTMHIPSFDKDAIRYVFKINNLWIEEA